MPNRATHAYVASSTRSRGSACTLTPSSLRGNTGFADRFRKAGACDGDRRKRNGPAPVEGGPVRSLPTRPSSLELDVLRRLRREVLGDDLQADRLADHDLVDRRSTRRVPLARGGAVLVVADEPVELQRPHLVHGLLDAGLAQVAVLDGLLEDLVDRPALRVPEGEVLVRLLVRGVLLLSLDHLCHARDARVAPRRPFRHQQEVIAV